MDDVDRCKHGLEHCRLCDSRSDGKLRFCKGIVEGRRGAIVPCRRRIRWATPEGLCWDCSVAQRALKWINDGTSPIRN